MLDFEKPRAWAIFDVLIAGLDHGVGHPTALGRGLPGAGELFRRPLPAPPAFLAGLWAERERGLRDPTQEVHRPWHHEGPQPGIRPHGFRPAEGVAEDRPIEGA